MKSFFQRTLILAPPCRDSTVTRKLSAIISNYRMSLLQYTLKFSNFINTCTNSFGEEVIELYLDHLLPTKNRLAWNILFLPLWKDFGSRFDCIISSLKKQRDFVDVEATFDAVEAKGSHTRLRDEIQQRQNQLGILEDNEKKTRFSQLQHSIAWLSDDEKIQETEYERTLNRRHDRTCEWITNEPQLKNWIKDDTTHPCLWLDGKPGSGTLLLRAKIMSLLIPLFKARASCARILFKH